MALFDFLKDMATEKVTDLLGGAGDVVDQVTGGATDLTEQAQNLTEQINPEEITGQISEQAGGLVDQVTENANVTESLGDVGNIVSGIKDLFGGK
ncbi:hypothetical protein HCJ66_10790 [Listeria sp. FSL L7-1582]|uniref:Uncharacterized protein n=2 Tax=Listeria TaxID=1637 RepID=A0A7W1T6G5_9LIST|nr:MULTISPECIES: hypothetical protein [Listeria]MBA3926334.1 hypothetical protein [Listeria rustica]MBC1499170.1 hypothetical protein [Listeria weihenstephanensis]MBC6310026.1 hypothetical protein [Listeria portnoyi]